jgi:hypothetical protein
VAQWISPYGIVPLVANSAWRMRVRLDAGGATLPADTTPLIQFVVDNFDQATGVVNNKYGLEYFVLDNLGGANSPGLGDANGGRNTFDFWFTPLPVTADDWNDATNGIFAPAMDANNDMRLQYRIIEADGIGYGGEFDEGTVCMTDITIDRYDIRDFPVADPNVYNVQEFTNGLQGGTTSVQGVVDGGTGNVTSVTFANGDVTIAPNTSGPQGNDAWDLEVVDITPGDNVLDVFNNPSETPDNFPIVQQTDKLYKLTMGATAPNAIAETNPVDVIKLGFDNAVTETIMLSNVVAALDAIGLPKQGVVTDYVSLFFTHNKTASTVQEADRIRPRAQLILFDGVSLDGQQNNLGGITLTYMKVEELQLPVD